MARVSSRSLIASLLLALFMPALAACGGTALPAPAITTPQPAGTAVVASVIPPAPEPTATEPVPTPTPTPEPTSSPEPTPEPTAVPELGQTNDANQWWDGAGWQALPEGEGFQLSVAEDGTVTAVDASGTEYTWENGGWKLSIPPTPEIQLAEGEAVFETTLGSEIIRAAVPEQVVPILAAAGTEPGQYEEVDKAVWKVDENAIVLGKIPVFVRDGSEWRYNEQVVYEENYINLGPALVLPNVSSFENPELASWPPAGLFIDNEPGLGIVSVSGQLAAGEISEVVLLSMGGTFETQRALLEFKYMNPNTGNITSFRTTQHDAIWVDNVERSFSSLSGMRNAIAIVVNSSGSFPEFRWKMMGTELSPIEISNVHSIILQGGDLSSEDAAIIVSFGQY